MHNRIKSSFDGIKADDAFKAGIKTRLEKSNVKKNSFWTYKKTITAVAACMLILCLGWIGHYLYYTPITVISVDVNPSVELGINRFDKVVSLEAFNDEGEKIAASVNVIHMNYEDAVDTLLNDTDFAKYAEAEGLVYVTVFGDDDEKGNTVTERLNKRTEGRSDVQCTHSSEKKAGDAHKHGLSMGKYEAYLELKSHDPNVTVEEAKKMTMRQIKDRINEKGQGEGRPNGSDRFDEDASFDDKKENGRGPNGNGHNRGTCSNEG